MKRYWGFFIFLAMTVLALTGCAYPQESRAQNQIPDVDQLAAVQRAVNDFQAETGVLPIKDSEPDTDIFIKYKIDFNKLVPKYIAAPPANSYEKGGLFQYVLWNAENDPTVKLVDLRVPERMREVNMRFMATAYPQYKDKIVEHIYTINFENIGYKEEVMVQSPYSANLLPIIVTAEGDLYVDYAMDLYQFMKDNEILATPGQDIRAMLADAYPVVPAYSLPYTVDDNNEPIFMYDPLAK
ncbi:MAG: hypothetical protein ABS951_01115 [Solibacillus sp.]